MSFDLGTFIRESNRIDPQPSFDGTSIIKGLKSGQPMFDNHVDAWFLCVRQAAYKEFTLNNLLGIHRELTKGIDFFESRGMSGVFRRHDVRIGGAICPSPISVPILIDKFLIPRINKALNQKPDGNPEEFAWEIHELFECIHPFIDGNGRTGRLLLNLARMAMGLEPIVIYYSDRHNYYAHIQEFRDSRFPQILKELSKEVFAV